MIQPTELRLNNWVYSIQLAKEVQVITIDTPEVCFTSDGVNYCTEYDSIETIPLSEEVLMKCGFKKIENNWKVLTYHGVFYFSWERLAGSAFSLEKESIYLPHIKYLHQLQNIYFALTNQELIYTP